MKKSTVIGVVLFCATIISIEARIDLALAICDGIGILGTAFIFRKNISNFIRR